MNIFKAVCIVTFSVVFSLFATVCLYMSLLLLFGDRGLYTVILFVLTLSTSIILSIGLRSLLKQWTKTVRPLFVWSLFLNTVGFLGVNVYLTERFSALQAVLYTSVFLIAYPLLLFWYSVLVIEKQEKETRWVLWLSLAAFFPVILLMGVPLSYS